MSKVKSETNKKAEAKETMKILAIIFLIAGCIVAVGFGIKTYGQHKGNGKYVEVQGTIVDYIVSNTKKTYKEKDKKKNHKKYNKNITTYQPVVEYVVDGVTYQVVGEYGSEKKEKSDTIAVKYNPENPNDAFVVQKGTDFVFIGLGIALFLVGLSMLLASSKKEICKKAAFVIGAFTALMIWSGLLFIIKEQEGSWNPLIVIRRTPPLVVLYFLIIVNLYIIIYFLVSKKERTGVQVMRCVEVREKTPTKDRVIFQLEEGSKKYDFYSIYVEKENNGFVTGKTYQVDLSKENAKIDYAQVEPYGRINYLYQMNEQDFKEYYAEIN